jgi:hypothetical protein
MCGRIQQLNKGLLTSMKNRHVFYGPATYRIYDDRSEGVDAESFDHRWNDRRTRGLNRQVVNFTIYQLIVPALSAVAISGAHRIDNRLSVGQGLPGDTAECGAGFAPRASRFSRR